jgi:hypothetical protein
MAMVSIAEAITAEIDPDFRLSLNTFCCYFPLYNQTIVLAVPEN